MKIKEHMKILVKIALNVFLDKEFIVIKKVILFMSIFPQYTYKTEIKKELDLHEYLLERDKIL